MSEPAHFVHDPPDPDEEVEIDVAAASLPGNLVAPAHATGVVLFAHGSGSSRHSPRNRAVAEALNDSSIATLLFDLLTPEEAVERANVFDIELLADRLVAATRWVQQRPDLAHLRVGYFGASTGGGAALWAAADLGDTVAAVVSRGGRPDLAAPRLDAVTAPTLLIVGSRDPIVVGLNQEAYDTLRSERRLEIVKGATHLFEEPGTLDEVMRLAGAWFSSHFPPVAG